MKPRTAPTAMKTVPSGMEDFCIKGALAVNGMKSSGTPAPAMVGRPVSWNTLVTPFAPVEVVFEPVAVLAAGKLAVAANEVPELVTPDDVAPVL